MCPEQPAHKKPRIHCLRPSANLIWRLQQGDGPSRIECPMYIAKECVVASLECPEERVMPDKKSEVLQGTLDLMVLKTLYAMGRLYGFGIGRRIEQVSDGVLDLNEGTIYTALLRLQQQGWIVSKWGTSEN